MNKYGGIETVDNGEWSKEGVFYAYVTRSEKGWGLTAAMAPGSYPKMLIGVDPEGLEKYWREEIAALREHGHEVKMVRLRMEEL